MLSLAEAVDAATLDWHETNLPSLGRICNIVHRKTCRPVTRSFRVRGTHLRAEHTLVTFFFVLKFGGGKHVLRIDHEQQILVGLEMDIPSVLRRGDVLHRCWLPQLSNIDDAEAAHPASFND